MLMKISRSVYQDRLSRTLGLAKSKIFINHLHFLGYDSCTQICTWSYARLINKAQCYLGSTDLFRSVSVQIFDPIIAYTCVQCQVIYPREQLFTIFELETMGFAQSEVSEHSLLLRNIAV